MIVDSFAKGVDKLYRNVEYKSIYGREVINKNTMFHYTSHLKGKEYLERVFKNTIQALLDCVKVKCSRVMRLASKGEWVNNQTIHEKMNKSIQNLSEIIKDSESLKQKDVDLVLNRIDTLEMIWAKLMDLGVERNEFEDIKNSLENLKNAFQAVVESKRLFNKNLINLSRGEVITGIKQRLDHLVRKVISVHDLYIPFLFPPLCLPWDMPNVIHESTCELSELAKLFRMNFTVNMTDQEIYRHTEHGIKLIKKKWSRTEQGIKLILKDHECLSHKRLLKLTNDLRISMHCLKHAGHSPLIS